MSTAEIAFIFAVFMVDMWLVSLFKTVSSKSNELKNEKEKVSIAERIGVSDCMIKEIDHMVQREVLIRDENYTRNHTGWRNDSYSVEDYEGDITGIIENVSCFMQPNCINQKVLIHTKSFYEHYIRCAARQQITEKVQSIHPELFHR